MTLRHAAAVRIGDRLVGPGHPTYVIAEIGANHNQDKGLALEMIARAAETGADAVKFQSIRYDRLHRPEIEGAELAQWFRAIELEEEWHADLAAAAATAGVDFLSSPTYCEAVDLLEACGVPAYKIASPQVQANPFVLARAARTGKPLIMSLGYCTLAEVEAALALCAREGNEQTLLLHCISCYPPRPEQTNLRFLGTLAALTGRPVGFSDHSPGAHMAVAAVALGACVIEKHVTLDRSLPGPDHHYALTFDEFADMVRQLREVDQALGDGLPSPLPADVEGYRERVKLKAFARHALAAGAPVTAADVDYFRAGRPGIGLDQMAALPPLRARVAIAAGSLLDFSMLELV